MSPWIAFTALTIAVLLLLVWPLLRRSGKSAARADYDLMVFRDQLAEVDRDLESGVIQADQAEAARLEIKHRMLRAGRQRGTEIIGRPPARTMVAAVVAVAVPAGAFGLYGVIGAPAIPDMPYAEVQAPQLGEEHQGAADIEAMVEKLEARLDANPGDSSGWALLGRSYRTLGRYDAAIDALRRAADLGPPNADLLGTLGEVVVASAQGMVVPEARQVFLETLGVQPGDPRARFYLGLARAQIGDAAGAIAVWKDLEQDSSPDVPWLTELRDEIAQTAATAGLDAATIAPKPETALTGTAAP